MRIEGLTVTHYWGKGRCDGGGRWNVVGDSAIVGVEEGGGAEKRRNYDSIDKSATSLTKPLRCIVKLGLFSSS